MTNRAKELRKYMVMHELKEHINFAEWQDNLYVDCVPVWALKWAYELLKEQEPVFPVAKQEMDEYTSYLETVYYCGNCGASLPLYKESNVFCPTCGRKVKWDE